MVEELEKIPLGEIIEKWDKVEILVPPRGERMSILSIRIDPDTLRSLELYAKSVGEKPTSVAREFIREGLAGKGVDLSLEEMLRMMMTRVGREQHSGKTSSS